MHAHIHSKVKIKIQRNKIKMYFNIIDKNSKQENLV